MAETNFKLSQIGVVMLGVQDLARSAAFYHDVLGLMVTAEIPGDFVFLNGGSLTLGLSLSLAKHTGRGPGATEIVFSVEDLTAAYEALKARGVQFKQEPRNVTGPMWAANFQDPDGHWLSIFGPKTAG